MEALVTSPFGQRSESCGLDELGEHSLVESVRADKWAVFRDLCTARAHFGVSHQTLAVLNALLTFHPSRALSSDETLVVFPSNGTLSKRVHGMPESTLRRHLASLVKSGLIARKDSPNRKRYARRSRAGGMASAFGFDLRPLLLQSQQIHEAADCQLEYENRCGALREKISLNVHKLRLLIEQETLANMPADSQACESICSTVKRELRRKLSIEELEHLFNTCTTLLEKLTRTKTSPAKMSTDDSQIERHHQRSKTKHLEEPAPADDPSKPIDQGPTLEVVLRACPEISHYAQSKVDHWHELLALANFVHGMMGISQRGWKTACATLGERQASITLAAMLENSANIKSPGAYLSTLTKKAEKGEFSPAPMIQNLLVNAAC